MLDTELSPSLITHYDSVYIKGHVEMVDTKDQSNAVVYGMFVDTVDMKIKACKCIECYVC